MPVLASLVLPKNIEERDALPDPPGSGHLCTRARILPAVPLPGAGAGPGRSSSRLCRWRLSFGSEFVPRLSEGAIVIGIVRPPGTSLEESIRVNTQIERMVLALFPDEVSHTWSRVGAPEVATDASSVELTDLFIALTPREQWKRASTQDELVELMEREVADIPGQINWFTQPIEQRINEMISGVRSDVAVKLFGDDFDTLVKYARELESILREVRGSADLATEQIVGQPVLQIRIRQDQVARYGVSAQLVLDTVQSIGSIELGDVIEGQIPFPLTARLPEHLRRTPTRSATF